MKKTTSRKTRNDIALEATTQAFTDLLEIIQDISSTEEVANERLLALRQQLINAHQTILSQVIRANTK